MCQNNFAQEAANYSTPPMQPHPTTPLICSPRARQHMVADGGEVIRSKKQVNWFIKQVLDGNQTKLGKQNFTQFGLIPVQYLLYKPIYLLFTPNYFSSVCHHVLSRTR